MNFISGVMVSVLASSAVDRGFAPRSCKTNDYTICICCFPQKNPQFSRVKVKTGWLGIRMMCLNEANCCFSELALQRSN